jgi:3-oxoacyl-[acyl-carrier-protein] synthase-3
MTSIVEVATYIPGQVRLADRADELDLSSVELRRYERAMGYDLVAYEESQSETDILLAAAGKLEGLAGCEDRVRYVLRPRTVRWPSPHPHSALREVQEELGRQAARGFALPEQACAGGLLAVDLAGALLAEDGDPDALALILVGEKTHPVVAECIPGMAVLGEATAAVLVSAGGRRDRVLGYAASTVPISGTGLTLDEDGVKAFGAVYGDTLSKVIGGALRDAATPPTALSMYLPHNVGKKLCLGTGQALGLSEEQVVTDTIGQIAHCWGADPFINFRVAVDQGRLDPGDRYLMTSVGLGATFAAMVLEH